jgi:4a-hydroxytetrahydrobiopterin dehydratase
MNREILGEEEIARQLENLDGWRAEAGNLKKRFTFQNFAESLDFVNRVGAIAESLDHHPDITFGWGYAEIATTTHDRGGITDFDLALAARIGEI